mmetsp:Transcript_26678/g.57995  ORF Transcript_26678/g.57995 Transcript_26678/m.57995 type:complete len:890 (-) Transcript_26678:597-3266(-)|eukprot:CAMPEP_0206443950 /NCGR_PEP_ID=MMETSP0324_2-20121206/14649_1 /ASSEMBLY_ACC=CAM_ASM_000836 /TAXON_ID=2866 /ORGANISM="Crypthecodinium cohnii, Strain Seligo" /LENGTH=889 /DNA_ID=CAMNT_0053911935 /DNA_START=71 /DNA_END=2740 /DNA_ORIENTATION=-
MHAAANGQLGNSWADQDEALTHRSTSGLATSSHRADVSESDIDIETGPANGSSAQVPNSEVVVLSQEESRRAAQILTERGSARRPMAKAYHYGRVLKCQDAPFEGLRRVEQQGPLVEAKKHLFEFFPFLAMLPFDWHTIQADILAGVTVAVMLIPQSMSYASIAGLPYKYGLYSACVPAAVYALVGQSRQLAVGPVAMVSLLIQAGLSGKLTEEECPASFTNGVLDLSVPQHEVCPDAYAQMAIFTAAVIGFIEILAKMLNLGFLVSFLGHPVTSGFTSGAAITIGLSQIKYILGYDLPKSEKIYDTIWNIVSRIDRIQWMTVVLGLTWLAFFIVAKRVAKKGGKFALLGPSSPLIGCVVGTLLLFLCTPLREDFHVKIVGDVPKGLFPVSIHHWDFSQFATVLPTALSTCLIGYMESIAIGKNLAAKHNYEIEAGQELFALGVSNLIGAMFSCYPVTGSFSRSAVANSTGALTQMAGLVTAIVMFCTLMFLTPLVYYLPSFVLAAIVISSIIPLIAYDEAIKLFKLKKVDFALWVVAFLGTLFLGVLEGILLAVLLSLAIVIYESVRPQITILWRIPGTTIYRNVKQESNGAFVPNVFIARVGSSIYFANCGFVKDIIMAYVEDLKTINPTEYIVFEMTAVINVDSTATHALKELVHDFRCRGIQVAFAHIGNRVEKTLQRGHVIDFVGEQWFFPTVNQAVVACLQHRHNKHAADRVVGTMSFQESNHEERDNRVVQMGLSSDEIGFSDEMSPDGTTIFLSLNMVMQVPGLMSALAVAIHDHDLTVLKANMEVTQSGAQSGIRFMYLVCRAQRGAKIDDNGKAKLRETLATILRDYLNSEPLVDSTSQGSFLPPSSSMTSTVKGSRTDTDPSMPSLEPQHSLHNDDKE